MNRIQNGTRDSKPTGNWYIINYSKHCFLHIIFKQQSFHIDACQETHIHQCRYEEDIFISLIETCLFFIYFKETYIFKHILFILFISSSLTRRVSCLCKLQPSSQKVNATFTCQGLMQTFFQGAGMLLNWFLVLNSSTFQAFSSFLSILQLWHHHETKLLFDFHHIQPDAIVLWETKLCFEIADYKNMPKHPSWITWLN